MREDRIDAYLRELEARLRVRGPRRRRIMAEVRGHLREGLAQDPAAIERFGAPAAIAAEFNSRAGRPRLFARRLLILWTAWLAAMGMGSATVWAAVDWHPAAHVRCAHGRAHRCP